MIYGSEKGMENEKPVHEVQIKKSFEIGIVPVTQKQWRTIMETEPWKGMTKIKEGDNFPATIYYMARSRYFYENSKFN